MSGTSPHLASMTDSFASSAATRTSAPSAICRPPPKHGAVDRGDDGARHAAPEVGHGLREVRRLAVRTLEQLGAVRLRAERVHDALHVEARAEGAPRAPEHDAPHARVVAQLARRVPHAAKAAMSSALSFSGRSSVTTAMCLSTRPTRTESRLRCATRVTARRMARMAHTAAVST